MDETHLRQQIFQATQQLWSRGLIVGDAGFVTAELHRRRFLATPPDIRRANLQPDDVICVDMGGLNIQGGTGLSETQWQLHRAAYKANLDDAGQPIANGRQRGIFATILAEPPLVIASIRMQPADSDSLQLPGCDPVPLLDSHDEQAVTDAVRQGPLVAIRDAGLLAAASDLPSALNAIERLDHAARIQLATGSSDSEGESDV